MTTLAEARADVAEIVLKHRAFRVGWSRGFQSALDLMGVADHSAAIVSPHDPLLDAVVARRRDELAVARAYRTPPLTAAQITAQVAWSHRAWERDIAERCRVTG